MPETLGGGGTLEADVGNFFVEDLTTGQVTQITDLNLERWWWWMPPSFSPDGKSLIFSIARDLEEDSLFDAWSVPVAGGEPTLVLENAAYPSYLPSGEIVFVEPVGGPTGDAMFVGRANGDRTTLVEGEEIWFPRASPDGTRVAYSDMGRVYVVEVATGEVSSVVDGSEAPWLDDDTLIVNGL